MSVKRLATILVLFLSFLSAAPDISRAGSFEGTVAYRKKDFAVAHAEFGSDVDEGAVSRFFLAMMQLRGEGIAKNEIKGMELLRSAAARGYPAAQYRVGLHLVSGPGGARALAQGKKLLRQAAEGRDYRAVVLLEMLERGKKADQAAVVSAVREAARKRNADAEYTLGFLHLTGDGVPKDPEQELHWYRAASADGNAVASFVLALLHQHGEGVKRDPVEAARLMKLAAERGHVPAMFFTATFFYGGFGVETDRWLAADWMRKAAEKNYVAAQFAYGMLLLSGDGVHQDKVKAVEWLGKAAKQGDEGAQEALQELVALRARPGTGGIEELRNAAQPLPEPSRLTEEAVRLEGKGIVLDRGEFGLKFSLPDLNDAYTPPSLTNAREPWWNRLQGGKFDIIFRPGL